MALVAAAALAVAAPAGAASPAPHPEFYGVTSATELSAAEMETMGRGGVGTLRVPFYWPHIQPQPPAPPSALPAVSEDRARWGATDAIVEAAARNGVRVVPFVYGTPSWVAADPAEPPIADPAARAAWQGFLAELVGRYGPGGDLWEEKSLADPGLPVLPITGWQIWNEPNAPDFFAPKPRPGAYRRLVALAGEAIHAADPGATVVLAGMFGKPSHGMPAGRFLRRFHGGGSASGFDAYAVHPYSPTLSGIARQVRRLGREIASGPAPDAPLWVTEIGWPTDGPARFRMVKSLQGQKRLLARSYRLLLDRLEEWRIERLIWYVWRDNDVQAECTVCRYSGLFTERLEPKPAWRKLTQFTGGRP